jgi:hypothetical protein
MAHIRSVSTMGHAPWRGSEELWIGAALRLRGAEHRVTVYVCASQPDPPRIAEVERSGAKVVRPRRPAAAPALADGRADGAEPPRRRAPVLTARPRGADLVVVSQGQTLDGLGVMRERLRRGRPRAPVAQANGDVFRPGEQETPEIGECYGLSRQNFFVSSNNWRLLCDQPPIRATSPPGSRWSGIHKAVTTMRGSSQPKN